MVGWGQLKDACKPAWMLGFQFLKVFSFPGLFPGLVFGTPIFQSKSLASSVPPIAAATRPGKCWATWASGRTCRSWRSTAGHRLGQVLGATRSGGCGHRQSGIAAALLSYMC